MTNFFRQRDKLFTDIEDIFEENGIPFDDYPITVELLLYGCIDLHNDVNVKLSLSVQNYILSTKRFP